MGTLLEFKKPKRSRKHRNAPWGPSDPGRGDAPAWESWRRASVVGFIIVLALIFLIQSGR